MRDCNAESLNRYMEEIGKAERKEEHFTDAVLNSDIIIDYLSALARFQTIASQYDMDISFSKFIDENV